MTNAECYNEGWDAYESGKNKDSYPYSVDIQIFYWLWGWDSAKETEEEK